ncbi:MAG: amidohydrolase family protein [Acidimicrobiia bacterium]|nr:amidohydrolase family protein [Acidimicrobiia bacterium]
MRYDLVIANGDVVDGSGLPRRRADVGVRDGRVVALGHLDGSEAGEVIDAAGMVVAPGIVDIHTHYDLQLTWDPWATASCYHGVTTVVAGNCGFSAAPTPPGQREFLTALFAQVEGMDPTALSATRWDFETFPEYLEARAGRLGVNLAAYLGHSNVRRLVMGADGSERAATAEEVEAMRRVVREAMEAGAAGLSSSRSPTHHDGDLRPVPSRLAEIDELVALVEETGRGGGGTVTFLPESAVGGLDEDDEDLLIELSLAGRIPIIIQGLGGRSKVDAPTATWERAQAFLDRATARGAAVYSLLITRPFDRPFNLSDGTTLYEGVPAWDRMLKLPLAERIRALQDPAVRDQLRHAVEHPNRDPEQGSTLPPPHWGSLVVARVSKPELERFLSRSVADIAAGEGKAPADALLDLALADDLRTELRWSTETAAWAEAVAEAQVDPHLLIGTSDGGAHLSRDDGSEFSTYFLRRWVLDERIWTLEEGIRQITEIPANLMGFHDRGMVRPSYRADLVVLDPEALGPWKKELVHDLPGGVGRFQAYPKGVHATVVNGVPIVRDGEITGALPGQVVRPGARPG